MKTKRVPGQNYQGLIGYRMRLGVRDALKALLGAPILLGMRLITPIPIPAIQTQANILVGGKPAHAGSSLEVVDIPPTPPEGPHAPEA